MILPVFLSTSLYIWASHFQSSLESSLILIVCCGWKGDNIARVKNTGEANILFQFSFSPEKLDVETVMSIDHLKQKIPPALFYKETYLGPSEGK